MIKSSTEEILGKFGVYICVRLRVDMHVCIYMGERARVFLFAVAGALQRLCLGPTPTRTNPTYPTHTKHPTHLTHPRPADAWVPRAGLLTARRLHGAAACHGKVYVFGG